MKRRSTTPVSIKGLATKSSLVATAVVMASAGSLSVQPKAYAEDYDAQIQALEQEISAYQQEAKKYSKQAASLQGKLKILASDKAQIQGQIELSQTKFKQLKQKIAQTEKDITTTQTALGETMANMYVDDEISPLEMLASSNSIADYVDKQEYRSSVSQQLSKAIDRIRELRKQLEEQKASVERTLADQKNARNALSAKEAEQQELLSKTQGRESTYKQLSAESNDKKLELQKQQQAAIEAAIAAAAGGSGSINVLPGDPNKGGYPWESGCYVDGNAVSHGGANGNGADPLGYGCRQCVSYTAWKVMEKTGYAPKYWGNANQWPGSASGAGYKTGSTPKAGSVGVISAGQYGHVVWIESVNGDGTVNISQYNYLNAGGSGWGHYSEMRVSAATYDTYIYF